MVFYLSGVHPDLDRYFSAFPGDVRLISQVKTWGFRIGLGVLILLVAAAVVLYLSVDYIVEQSVERGGTNAVGVETTVERTSTGLFSGSVDLTGLKQSNPDSPSFQTDSFLSLKNTSIRVRPGSLFENVIEVPKVHLDGLHMTIERHSDRENYRVILERLRKRLEGGVKTTGEDGWKYVIRDLKVSDIRVTFSGYPGMNRTLHLADVHMTDVGSEESPFTFTRMTALIFKTLFAQLLSNPELIPGAVVTGLNEGLRGLIDVGEVSVKAIGNITDGAGNVLGELGGEVGKAGGTAVEGIGEAVQGIFGGGEEEGGSDGGKDK